MKQGIDTYAKIALHNDFELTEKANKVINAKKVLGVGIKCPCEPDNHDRYCGSKFCMNEVSQTGICHCGLFRRK